MINVKWILKRTANFNKVHLIIINLLMMILLINIVNIEKAYCKIDKKNNGKYFRIISKQVNQALTSFAEEKEIQFNGDHSALALINLKNKVKNIQAKRDIIVAVIDTGIDYQHPFLQKNIHVFNDKTSEDNYGVDFSFRSPNSSKPFDSHGHGTHVAGIIKSVYPQVKILSLKYYNPDAQGVENLNSTIKALKYAVLAGVDIINYSGGGPEPSFEERQVLEVASKRGILVVAAAGNDHSNIDPQNKSFFYPASYGLKNIISVTAVNEQSEILPSSNWGRVSVDIAAPGNNIRSSFPQNRVGQMTGTSQATAFITGVAALLKAQNPHLSPMEIKDILIKTSKRMKGVEGKCQSNGIVDASLAVDYAIKLSDTAEDKKKLKEEKEVAVNVF